MKPRSSSNQVPLAIKIQLKSTLESINILVEGGSNKILIKFYIKLNRL